jgi:uncharacterized SAM-binding protein YcdF (DUF218 family)
LPTVGLGSNPVIQLFKRLVGEFATPLMIAVLISTVAAMFRLCQRRRTAAWLFVSVALVVYVGAVGWVADALLAPLERRYLPLQDGSLPAVGYIVVLGSSYAPRDGIPVTAALDEDGLNRIVEGIRLARRLGAVRLVASGGAPRGETPAALGYARIARDLGIDEASLVIMKDSLDTGAEARSIAALLGAAPFILVTSAYHMPRAMRLMERAGARPIPAPTGHLVNQSVYKGWSRYFPTSSGLRKTDRALHEYLGLAALSAGVD